MVTLLSLLIVFLSTIVLEASIRFVVSVNVFEVVVACKLVELSMAVLELSMVILTVVGDADFFSAFVFESPADI